MAAQYHTAQKAANEKNKSLEEQAETMRLSILGKDTKVRDDKPLAVVDAYISENRTELMDPLGAMKLAEELRTKTATLWTTRTPEIFSWATRWPRNGWRGS